MKKLILAVSCLIVLSGCASSNFSSVPPGAQVHVGKTDVSGETSFEGRVPRTTFGQYPIKIKKEGHETFYGILPLNVSGGVILLDALLFAPAAFFNVQGSLLLRV